MSNPTTTQAPSAAILKDEFTHYAPEFLEVVISTLRDTLTNEVRKAFGENSPQLAMIDSLDWLDYVLCDGANPEEMDLTHKALVRGINAATQCGAVWTNGIARSIQRGE
jgi:hypothetical protein